MLKKAVLIFLRYVLPGIATVTGVLAWVFAANLTSEDEPGLVLAPEDSFPRVTFQIEVPEIPTIDESPTGNEPIGEAECVEDSKTSNQAIRCLTNGEVLDPCYLPGEPDPSSVFCFDPVAFSHNVYSVDEISNIVGVGTGPEPTFVLVDLSDNRNISDYPEEAIEVRGRYVDVCTLDDKSAEGVDVSYSCITGSQVLGPVYGESPQHFVEYLEDGEAEAKSRYLSYIIYG